jgi:Fic-DOC domain mobile mystery protein B
MLDGQPIPGQTPLPDLSGLRDASIRTVGELNACEAENIRRAVVRYLAARPSPRRAPFDEPWLRALHRQMLGDVWSWAGTYRRHETNIGSPPPRIAVEVHGLVDDLQAWRQSSMDILEQAVRLHHRAVQIHPFANGNGRWSRMLASIWLRLHGHAPVEWPEAAIGGASIIRGEYLDALRAADAGDVGPLRRLHERHLGRP